MTSTSLVPANDPGALQLVIDLERAGALTPTSLDLTDAGMPFDQWLSLGRMFGHVGRSINWWTGDWINFGEDVYGEEYAEGVDALQSRYVEAERITGLDHGTLMNISSVCRRIARSRRRSELGFWIHAEVAALEPEKQAEWLEEAIQCSWTRADLRRAIRGEDDPPPGLPGGGDGGRMAPWERIEEAARVVLSQSQQTPDGDYIVPGEAWVQLSAAMGGD